MPAEAQNDPIVELIEELEDGIKDIDNEDVLSIYNNFRNKMDNAVMLMNTIGNTREEIEVTLKTECDDVSLRNLLLARECKRLLDVDINYRCLLDNQLITCLTAFKDIIELLSAKKAVPIQKKVEIKKEAIEKKPSGIMTEDIKELIKEYEKCTNSRMIDEQKEIELAVIYEEAERLGREKFEIFKKGIGDER